jgi:acyl carrier protein phosphodiesterase
MNWIAHIFLSEYNIDFQIGNYLADPLKGKIWQEANENLKKGMNLHKTIDSYTDSHQIFKRSKQRIGKGVLRAVVIDLTYDYLLTKNWDKFCKIPMDAFFDEFNIKARNRLKDIPKNAQLPLERLIDYDILNRYKTLQDLEKAFLRVDKKLSQRLLKRDSNSRYFGTVSKNISNLEDDFLEFFPQLCFEIKKYINESKLTHWKI